MRIKTKCLHGVKIHCYTTLEGTFGPHNVGNTKYTHTHTRDVILIQIKSV